MTVEEIQKLKTEDWYALVCKECNTVTVKEVANAEEVANFCHDGGSIHCASCDKKFTLKRHRSAGNGHTTTKVTIVNAECKECMIVVPFTE